MRETKTKVPKARLLSRPSYHLVEGQRDPEIDATYNLFTHVTGHRLDWGICESLNVLEDGSWIAHIKCGNCYTRTVLTSEKSVESDLDCVCGRCLSLEREIVHLNLQIGRLMSLMRDHGLQVEIARERET